MDEESRIKLNRPLVIAAVAAALLLGLIVGGALDIGKRLFGGPDPETVASSALQSMRAQNRLVPFVARYVSVVSSRQERFGGLVSSERTLILPGDVRYELDLAKLGPGDVRWDAAGSTLSVTLPKSRSRVPKSIWPRRVNMARVGCCRRVTDAKQTLDRNNRARAVADLRKQAGASVPMRLAREAGRQAVERSFALPLQAAGFDNAKVVARYPTEGSPVTKPLDRSRSYNEVMEEAAAR